MPYDADDSSLFACSTSSLPYVFNVNFYCNNQLDNLYVQEQSTADPTARQQLFNQIHQIYLFGASDRDSRTDREFCLGFCGLL